MTSSAPRILVADFGATNARLRTVGWPKDSTVPYAHRTLGEGDEALRKIFQSFPPPDGGRGARIDAVAVAVAGRVVNGRCRFTNVGLEITRRKVADLLAERFDVDESRVVLLNDALAHAWSVADAAARGAPDPAVAEAVLAPARPAPEAGGLLVSCLALGTGLGEGHLAGAPPRLAGVATEAGHTDFPPATPEQRALVEDVHARRGGGPVAWEEVLSGRGLAHAVTYLLRLGPASPGVRERWEATPEGERPRLASALADQAEPAAVRAFALLSEVLGQACGNAALRLPRVVLVAGGFADVLRRRLSPALFRAGFLMRSREEAREVAAGVPVWWATRDDTALLGAERLARARAAGDADAEPLSR